MPLATHTLSGDLSALIGERDKVSATIHLNTEDGNWVNETDGTIVLGSGRLYYTRNGGTGEFSVTLPTSTGTGLQYEVRVDYTDETNKQKPNQSWRSGWFPLTTDSDLAERAANSSLFVPMARADVIEDRLDALEADTGTGEALAELGDRLDGVTDHGNVSGGLELDSDISTHWLDATGATVLSFTDGPSGGTRYVSVLVVSGADDVTVDGLDDVTLTDGGFATFAWVRGSWILAGSGASGEAPVTDSTPPSAVTDLAVDPDDDGTTATATWSAATDAESTVKYRYRLYENGDTPTAWPTSGPQYNLTVTTVNLTGLTPGIAYVMEVQAYSAGGGAAADAATFVTPLPAGWNAWDSIDFADQADGTYAPPKDFTTDTGKTLRGTLTTADPGSVVVTAGKVKGVYQQARARLGYASAVPPAATRVTAPFELVGTNPSYGPGMIFRLTLTTGNVPIIMELDWTTGTTRRMSVGADFSSGYTITPDPDALTAGYTWDGEWLRGIPTSGTLVLEPLGPILNIYINEQLILVGDYSNNAIGGTPNPFLGKFNYVEIANDAAIYSLLMETHS